MHVTTTRRHYKDKVYETHLLRRSVRIDGKVHNETLANLSHLPPELIELIRASLKGETFIPAAAAATVTRSLPHGHLAAAWAMATRLGLPALLGPAGRQRDLAVALIVSRVVRPASKLSTATWWTDTSLGVDLDIAWPARTRCTPRWTGCWNARTPSKPPWPAVTWRRIRGEG